MANGVQIKGLDNLLKRLDKYPAEIQQRVDAEVKDQASQIAKMAKQLAPVDFGLLRGSIKSNSESILKADVVATVKYAAYVEFGTGKKAQIPNGLEGYARQFYVNGKGRTRAQPYFFRSELALRGKFLKRVAKAIAYKK